MPRPLPWPTALRTALFSALLPLAVAGCADDDHARLGDAVQASTWSLADDSDQDGVHDAIDQCYGVAEDVDGFEDADGCPEDGADPTGDADGDGVVNQADGCPNTREDVDGVADDDGCPEPEDGMGDADGDGIWNGMDACIHAAEDYDAYRDLDGCPEDGTDVDEDGVWDDADECLGTKEDHDGEDDEDGCPDVWVYFTRPEVQCPDPDNVGCLPECQQIRPGELPPTYCYVHVVEAAKPGDDPNAMPHARGSAQGGTDTSTYRGLWVPNPAFGEILLTGQPTSIMTDDAIYTGGDEALLMLGLGLAVTDGPLPIGDAALVAIGIYVYGGVAYKVAIDTAQDPVVQKALSEWVDAIDAAALTASRWITDSARAALRAGKTIVDGVVVTPYEGCGPKPPTQTRRDFGGRCHKPCGHPHTHNIDWTRHPAPDCWRKDDRVTCEKGESFARCPENDPNDPRYVPMAALGVTPRDEAVAALGQFFSSIGDYLVVFGERTADVIGFGFPVANECWGSSCILVGYICTCTNECLDGSSDQVQYAVMNEQDCRP